jgi:hypothetical protein
MPALIVSLFLSCFSLTAFALEIADVPIEARTSVEQKELLLNGAGLRTKYLFKVYVAALYVQEPSSSANQIITQPGFKRMQLTLLRDLSAKQLVESLQQGLEQNLSSAALTALQPRLATFENVIERLHEGHKGDVLALDFMPNTGTQLRLNGAPQGAPISGNDFLPRLAHNMAGRQAGSGQPEAAIAHQQPLGSIAET